MNFFLTSFAFKKPQLCLGKNTGVEFSGLVELFFQRLEEADITLRLCSFTACRCSTKPDPGINE